MNVVPRSTMNSNGETELTLKCKLNCYVLCESPLGEKSEYIRSSELEHLRKSSLLVWRIIIRLTSEVVCLFSLVDLC